MSINFNDIAFPPHEEILIAGKRSQQGNAARSLVKRSAARKRPMEDFPVALKMQETISMETLKMLLETLPEGDQPLPALQKILDRVDRDTGMLTVSYYKRSTEGIGRLYSQNSCSLGTLRGAERAQMTQHLFELDMENAHPRFLLGLGRQLNCKRLQPIAQVVYNRESVLRAVHTERKEAKRLVLAVIFGEGLKPGVSYTKAFLEFRRAVHMVRDTFVCSALSAPYMRHAKSTNSAASALSFYLGDVECRALLCAKQWLESRDRVPEVLLHDGMFVRRLEDGSTLSPDELVRLNAHVKEETNLLCRFTVK